MAANLAPSRCTDTDKSWWPMHRKPKADDENQNEFAVAVHASDQNDRLLLTACHGTTKKRGFMLYVFAFGHG